MQLVSTQNLVRTIYYDFYGNSARFCQNRDNRRGCPLFGHFKGRISQSVKDNEDRSHDTLTTVKVLASNSKVSKRYESRKTAYEQRDYRFLRSRT